MYVLLWLNTVAVAQMFFLLSLILFSSLSIIFKEDGNTKFKQTQCYSRLSKLNLEILPIYRKNILGKQLSQAIL